MLSVELRDDSQPNRSTAPAMATQTTYPGWGEWVARGATTMWETWTGDSSRNHHMYSDVDAWFWRGNTIAPAHTCGGHKDTRNDPGIGLVLEPYFNACPSRCYGNGILTFSPDFSAVEKAEKVDDLTVRVTLRGVEAKVALAARDQAWDKGEGIGGFDPFGRGVLRLFLEASPQTKKSRANYLSVEFQDCFGHALVEVLRSPTDEGEILATAAGLRAFGDELKRRSIVSVFGFGPSDDEKLSMSYHAAGFRKTGLLARGIQVGNERRDAILWSRKLFNPAGEPGAEE